MACIDHFVDIYALDRYETEGILGDDDRITSSNVIFITIAAAKEKKLTLDEGSNLVCDKCSRKTLFLYEASIGRVCPPCLNEHWGERRSCHACYRKIGCDSCGGMNLGMVEANGPYGYILLCLKNKCLMPFGYYVDSFKCNARCSCERDIFRLVKKKLPTDLHPFVRNFLVDPSFSWDYWMPERPIHLGDLSWTRKDRCLPCQLSAKYKHVKGMQYSRACSCSDELVGTPDGLDLFP